MVTYVAIITRWTLDLMVGSNYKEQFSVAYLTAIAAQAGLNHNSPVIDEDSVDISLIGTGYLGLIRNPQIDIQLKCTSQNVIEGDKLKYDLKLKNYNDLRGENIANTRYLMILVVPDHHDDWLVHGVDDMALQRSLYWTSLRFEPETNNTSQVRIEIPTSQKVTTPTLLSLMDMASKLEYV